MKLGVTIPNNWGIADPRAGLPVRRSGGMGNHKELTTMAGASTEDTLRALDASIDALASTGECAGLASLLAADFRYTHSTGARQDKAAWLEGLKPLVGRRQRVASAIQIERHGDLAVAMGDLDIIWSDGRHNYDRYVRVYRL